MLSQCQLQFQILFCVELEAGDDYEDDTVVGKQIDMNCEQQLDNMDQVRCCRQPVNNVHRILCHRTYHVIFT